MPSGSDKEYTVTIQDPALDMLLQHTRFLAQVSESAAVRLTEDFFREAKTLESMPERCPWLIDPMIPEYKYRKLIFGKYYMLIFQINGDQVFIDAMLDCRQDYTHLL